MPTTPEQPRFKTARDKFLGLSLESSRKSYYPQLKEQLDASRENEQRLQLLIDSLPAFISYIDNRQRYLLVNRQCETKFGLPREAIIGQPIAAVIKATDYAELQPHIQAALDGLTVRFESAITFPDGSERWLENSYIPVRNRIGTIVGFYTLSLDLTEKKLAENERVKLEEKLRDAAKLKSIGTLAGGIAHDFNNLLMGIQGRISLIDIHLDENSLLREHLQAIEGHINSAANLTKQLLGLARGGKYEAIPLNVNRLISDTARMFGRTHKEIVITSRLYNTPVIVEADRTQLEQVLLNIFVNASLAMPEGGTIYLETTITELEQTMRAAHDLSATVFARISITDTGCGMDKAVRQQVFDPFFTTRIKQRGTGLGLASAYGIIKNHGGIITVYSEPGHGATFNVYLPLSDKEARQIETPPGEQLHYQGCGTILLVDDEEIIRDVGQALLGTLGYQPITASSGMKALELLADPDHTIDLVIVDLIMPVMDGGKVFDSIRELHPDLPVILSSGYSINGQASAIMARGCNGFIQKPFTIKELSRIIQRVLSGN